MLGKSIYLIVGLLSGYLTHSQVTFPPYKPDVDLKRASRERFKAAVSDTDPVNLKILSLVVDLGNTVSSKKAASDLHT